MAALLYRSGRAGLLWLLVPVTLAPALLAAWLVALPSEAQLLADFGSTAAARAWQVGMVALGSLLFWPLCWLSGRYVLRVEQPAAGAVRLRLWTLLGARTREWQRPFAGGEAHDGLSDVQATAPWTGYRTPEGRLLVVDGRGEFPQGEDALRTALLLSRD